VISAKRLLVCDLDNTLYDWVGYFVPSFYAMVDMAAKIISCDRECLLDDMRVVHQKFGDSEQPFALLQTEAVKRRFKGMEVSDVLRALDPAFHAFNSERKARLRLYDDVLDSLHILKSLGVTLVAHTESRLFGALDRMGRLSLLDVFTKLYCKERSPLLHPDVEKGALWLDRFSVNKVRELLNHQSKPNAEVLLEICGAEGTEPKDAAYVGDSIARDMMMAKRAGVLAVWAAYGARHDPDLYAALVRVSHWTPAEVARERMLSVEARSVKPDYIIKDSFREIIAALGYAEKGDYQQVVCLSEAPRRGLNAVSLSTTPANKYSAY
jgi:FMN phosphatase YigB (HAD superfamily)